MFQALSEYLQPPAIYTPSATSFWTDEHISKHLLETHLDPNTDLASRKLDFIEKSVHWIGDTVPPSKYPKLLDVGCGPGIYAERFTQIGHEVTGIDFSKRSIEYARNHALKEGLSITYLHQNYLQLSLNEMYDFATMIFCDYGALSDKNRVLLMSTIHDRLRPGGRFLLDVCSTRHYTDFEESQTWEIRELGGFWSPEKYIRINANLKYQDYTTLSQSVVVTSRETQVYYIWNHCFTKHSLIAEAAQVGFRPLQIYEDVAGRPFTVEGSTIAILLEKQGAKP